MIDVAIIGAAGLSGLELIPLLDNHPRANLKLITSGRYAGQPLSENFPRFAGSDHVFSEHEADATACDVAFLAIPDKASLETVPRLLSQGVRVVDLSGVYRLRDVSVFEQFYNLKHTSPTLLSEAVLGCLNISRTKLPSSPGSQSGVLSHGSAAGSPSFWQSFGCLGLPTGD